MYAEETPVIRLQGIARHYAGGDTVVKALDGIDLEIHRGEFVAIMGQSGSGKSTMMNIIGCLDKPTHGSYRVNGREASALSADELAALRRETFGFIFQRYNLLAGITTSENVEVPALYAGLPAPQRRSRAHELLDRLGLGHRTGHKPPQLSGGQQQRVAIARALMNEPDVILADEPTGALDSRSGAEVMELLKEIHARGTTLILITHDEQVASHAHRIIRMQDGRIVADTGRADASPPQDLHEDMPSRHEHGRMAQIRESVRIALHALRTNIFRTALTLLGIVIGVAAVVTMLAIGEGSKQKVLEQISSLGTNILSVRPGAPGMRPSGDVATLTLADAEAISEIPNISIVVPERSGRKTVRYENRDVETNVQGVGRGMPDARDWPVAQGAFFNDRDESTYAAVAVLGKTTASALFPEGVDPVGHYILIGTIPFEVIGVLASKGAAPWGGDQDDTVFVPYTTGMIRLFGGTHLNSITLKIADTNVVEETQEEVRQTVLARHKVEDFSIRNTASFLATATETQNTLTILLGAVAAISLLVGGIGVMNIMLVSVTERTREIGIRMATGARSSDIMIQFNTEAAVVCIVGGLIGVTLGFAAGFAVSAFGVDVVFTAGPALLAFSCAVATGLLFGFLPARKASKLDPVVALASE